MERAPARLMRCGSVEFEDQRQGLFHSSQFVEREVAHACTEYSGVDDADHLAHHPVAPAVLNMAAPAGQDDRMHITPDHVGAP